MHWILEKKVTEVNHPLLAKHCLDRPKTNGYGNGYVSRHLTEKNVKNGLSSALVTGWTEV